MKTIAILFVNFLIGNAFSQEIPEKEIKTDVNNVTVFIEGAQVTRKKDVDVMSGITMLKFVNLSPFIDAKSVQVKASGEITVLSVNHQQNFMDKSAKLNEIEELQQKDRLLDDKINLENAYLSIIKEELDFLKQNRSIGGTSQNMNVTNLKEIADYYSTKLTSLKLKEIERNKTLEELKKQKNNINNQIGSLTNKSEYPTGEILVKFEAKKPTKVILEISYVVSNASWFPTYDIRAKNINEPVQLIYKANVRQDTKEEWKDVKLRFSSSNPNNTGVAPELKPYYLNYNTLPPSYNRNIGMVRGHIVDAATNEPLPGVSILVQGTTIGSVSDLNGNYSIVVPNNAAGLLFSYLGYLTQNLPISNTNMNVALAQDIKSLDEVVVLGYGTKKDMAGVLQGRSPGIAVDNKRSIKIRGTNSLSIPLVQVERQTTVDFEIKSPYTIKSDNKNYTIDMEAYDLPATFKYYCVPKVDKDAFLIAYLVDWEKYNLLEGEANIFFEDTYVGKTILDVKNANDTMSISLGRDKSISVNRQKVKDFTTKQFLGSKKEETRAWNITVKNNKSQKIDMVIIDQVPVSTLEEIEVNTQKISSAQHNMETGEIKWDFSIDPGVKKDFELNYSVKYPKSRSLIIE